MPLMTVGLAAAGLSPPPLLPVPGFSAVVLGSSLRMFQAIEPAMRTSTMRATPIATRSQLVPGFWL